MADLAVRKIKCIEVRNWFGMQTVVFESGNAELINSELIALGIHGVRVRQVTPNKCEGDVDFTIWNNVRVENGYAIFEPTRGGMYDGSQSATSKL